MDGAQVNGATPAGDPISFNALGAITGGSPVAVNFTPSGGAAAMNVTIDFNNTSQYGSPFSVQWAVSGRFCNRSFERYRYQRHGCHYFPVHQWSVTGAWADRDRHFQ